MAAAMPIDRCGDSRILVQLSDCIDDSFHASKVMTAKVYAEQPPSFQSSCILDVEPATGSQWYPSWLRVGPNPTPLPHLGLHLHAATERSYGPQHLERQQSKVANMRLVCVHVIDQRSRESTQDAEIGHEACISAWQEDE